MVKHNLRPDKNQLKHWLTKRMKLMINKRRIKALEEEIVNLNEEENCTGKYKRYNELWNNKYKYRDYMTVTEEEEGGYIYLGYIKLYGWGVDRCYYVFKIGQTQDCAKCRIRKQHLTKILAIKVKDAKKVETAILNRCYNKNIERCCGRNCAGLYRTWDPEPFEKIHGREWFATKWTPDAFEKMKKELVEIVNDTLDYWKKIAVEIQQLKEKNYYIWSKERNGKWKKSWTNWYWHYEEEMRLTRKFCESFYEKPLYIN
jgi:hypothetical protein